MIAFELRDSLVLVELGARLPMRPDLDDERVDALFGNPAAPLRPRDDGTAPDIEGQDVKRGLKAEVLWPLMGLSRPIVEPESFGQIDIPFPSRLDDRGNEQPWPEHVLEILVEDIRVVGKDEGQRPDDGESLQPGFECGAIDVGEKLVS